MAFEEVTLFEIELEEPTFALRSSAAAGESMAEEPEAEAEEGGRSWGRAVVVAMAVAGAIMLWRRRQSRESEARGISAGGVDPGPAPEEAEPVSRTVDTGGGPGEADAEEDAGTTEAETGEDRPTTE